MSGAGEEQGKGGALADAAPRLQLFFSYSRTDQKQAMPLIRALEQQGFAVWWDGLLEGGDNFLPTTEAALHKADAVVVLWSKTSIDSHWVRDEATVGRDRRRLVPLSMDGSLPPLGFRQFQVIDVTRWNGKATAPELKRIASAIAAVSNAPAAGSAPAQIGNAPAQIGHGPAQAGSTNRRNLLIAMGLLAGAGGIGAWRWFRPEATADAANSVAVLPFRNLSGRADQDYFAEGVAEELRTTLSLNRQLLVSGSASAGGFRNAEPDTRQVARALGVSNLLMGSVRPSQDRVRITARLVDGNTGLERWSQAFDRGMADVLAVQAEIATTVADALISTLAKDANWRAERPGSTRNAAAFDAYAKGEALYHIGGGSSSDAQALAAYDKAIAIDPDYGVAYASRARTLAAIANQESSVTRGNRLRSEALASARKAIALAPDMPEGHSSLGFLLMTQLDIGSAKSAYQRAFELGLGNASILSAFAEFSSNIGDFDNANAAIKRATRLDPLSPSVFRNAGMIAFAAKDYSAARVALATALSLNPRQGIVHYVLGDMALIAGDVAEARRQYAAEPSRLSQLRGLAIADARLSGPAAGEAQMAKLVAEYGDGGLYQQAQVLAQWGRIDLALATLERALALRDSGLVLALNDALLDPLRSQARFQSVLARIGFSSPA
ncbi:TIR domain-containing protein [Sandarakinorhabdus limnophila]|uniref:TIR domain-containing protein n=1 Tax=Sandarakinorhabdus limnophila TaxID=210512 RepID=UPI0026EEA1E6|nr:TIR domain-containing protein [Sandarakinorhabdus limnophila]MCM0032110.1 TIR domain-containing protein [Sandarakinorhabdus limnophila]